MERGEFNWANQRVLVTGGASFIGSHLVERLLRENPRSIRVVDDFSSGKIQNLEDPLKQGVELVEDDLLDQQTTRRAVKGVDIVFHLAAKHGGRGYVDLHQGQPTTNLVLSGLVFLEAMKADVDKVVFASSGCAYRVDLQTDPNEELYLTEDLIGPPYYPDNMYGFEKLAGELSLRAYHRDFGLRAAICRYFTVYGTRGQEDHAIMAMIARAFIKQNPFEVWGDGTQVRNWTYVADIVEGTILAAEKINDGTAVNLGTMERTRVIDAARMIMELTGHQAQIKLLPDMPTGPANRIANNTLAKELLGWEPKFTLLRGLGPTIEWYFSTHDPNQVRDNFYNKLMKRPLD